MDALSNDLLPFAQRLCLLCSFILYSHETCTLAVKSHGGNAGLIRSVNPPSTIVLASRSHFDFQVRVSGASSKILRQPPLRPDSPSTPCDLLRATCVIDL